MVVNFIYHKLIRGGIVNRNRKPYTKPNPNRGGGGELFAPTPTGKRFKKITANGNHKKCTINGTSIVPFMVQIPGE